jgi:hypothetical protein
MGYRLASAGPRTRQRLLDRETATHDREPVVAGLPVSMDAAEDRLPALSAWDDAAWDRRISGEPEPALARLSVERTGFPVWRAAALLASAACGFSLVLWGQSLHGDHTLRHSAARGGKALVVADSGPPAAAPVAQTMAPVPPAPPADTLSALPPLAKPATEVAAAATPSVVVPPIDQHPATAVAPGAAAEAPGVAPSLPQPIPPASAPVEETGTAQPAVPVREAAGQPARAKPTHWASAASPPPADRVAHAAPRPAEGGRAPNSWASAPTMRPLPRRPAEARMVLAQVDRKPAAPKPRSATRLAEAHYALPRWLTDDHPEHAAPLIMSPPPHNLEPPPGAQFAAASPPPAHPAQAKLPPIPEPRPRPPVIYAEAHYPPPPRARPYYNAAPYFGGTPHPYGYYGAMPPPTPYGEP